MNKLFHVLLGCIHCAFTIHAMDSKTAAQKLHIIFDLGVVVRTEQKARTSSTTLEHSQGRQLLEQLKSQHTTHLLAECDRAQFDHLNNRHPDLFKHFNGIVMVAGDTKSSKTTPGLYAHFFHTSRLDPAACVFIDVESRHMEAVQHYGQQQRPKLPITTLLYEQNNPQLNEKIVAIAQELCRRKNTESTTRTQVKPKNDPLLLALEEQEKRFGTFLHEPAAAAAAASEQEDSTSSISSVESASSTESEVRERLAELQNALTASHGSLENPLFAIDNEDQIAAAINKPFFDQSK